MSRKCLFTLLTRNIDGISKRLRISICSSLGIANKLPGLSRLVVAVMKEEEEAELLEELRRLISFSHDYDQKSKYSKKGLGG